MMFLNKLGGKYQKLNMEEPSKDRVGHSTSEDSLEGVISDFRCRGRSFSYRIKVKTGCRCHRSPCLKR